MKKIFLLFAYIFLFSTQAKAKDVFFKIDDAELIQLNQIYTKCGGDNWTNKDGWPLTTGEQSERPNPFGVNFIDSTIQDDSNKTVYLLSCVEITMENNNLKDTLPSLTFLNLQYLTLNNNELSGGIPILVMPNLLFLALNNNQLSETIPNFDMPNLRSLNLSYNKLTGLIPDFDIPALQDLAINNNQLIGAIPNFNMPNLQSMWLSNNQLYGSIPNFNMPELQNLSLALNKLSGSIPNFNMPNLQGLYLSFNALSGSIPNFTLPSLQGLDLSFNKLSGVIPNFNNSSLQVLYLNNNLLNGATSNYSLPNLQVLYLDNNKLTFNELEMYVGFRSLNDNFSYTGQDTVLPLSYNSSSQALRVQTGGTNNHYQWFRGSAQYSSSSADSIILGYSEKPDWYSCTITNSDFLSLTLYTRSAADPNEITTPQLLEPANNSTKLGKDVVLSWVSQANATKYRVVILKSLSFGTLVLDSTLTSNSLSINNLDSSTTYYWHVQAINTSETSNWSEVWNFTTAFRKDSIALPIVTTTTAYDITKNSGFAGGAVVSDGGDSVTTRGVVWNVSATPTIELTTKTNDGAGVGSFVSALVNLSDNTTYYYRAYAINSLGVAYGGEYSFTTLVDFATIKPILFYPANNSINFGIVEELIWNSLDGINEYILEVSKDENFTNNIVEQAFSALKSGEFTFEYDTKYYWRVRGVKSGDSTGWSDVWNFTTKAKPNSVEARRSEDLSVYPNPAIDEITIKYEFGVNKPSAFLLINSIGQIATRLKCNDGEEIKKIDISNLPSGSYNILIELGDMKISYPVVIVK